MSINPNNANSIPFDQDGSCSEKPMFDEFFEEEICDGSERLYNIADNIALARINHLESQSSRHSVDKRKFTKAIAKVLFNRNWSPEIQTMSSLKAQESKIGSSLFGLRPLNERIEFFNDNRESWFFYQEITDSNSKKHTTTLHYEVRPMGVMRVNTKNGMHCEYIVGQEYDNFIQASEMYHYRVLRDIYNTDLKLNKKA